MNDALADDVWGEIATGMSAKALLIDSTIIELAGLLIVRLSRGMVALCVSMLTGACVVVVIVPLMALEAAVPVS